MSIFRKQYRVLTTAEARRVDEIKARAEDLLSAMVGSQTRTESRELSLAQTKLEEAVMWAVKAVTG